MARTKLRGRRHGIATAVAVGALLAPASTTSIADAATNPAPAVAASCSTAPNVGALDQDVSFRVTGPDSVEAGASTTFTIEPVEVTLPAEASGQSIDSYENISTSVEVYGATITGTTLSSPGSGLNSTPTVTSSGDVVSLTVPGPIAGGSTITTPGVAIDATVTADTGAEAGVRPADPFYELTVHTIITVTATCTASEPAAGTLVVPVTGADAAGPSITITAPYDGAVYGHQQPVTAAYTCTDPSGVASCTGTVAAGAAVDTSTQGAKTFTVDAVDARGNTSTRTVDYLVLPPGVQPPPPPAFTPLNPGRLLDTRDGATTVDGTHAGTGAAAPGQTIELQVAGRHGVPYDALAAVLNITATETQGWGYVTVYPCGEPRPNASNLNYTAAGDTRPNAVVAKLGAGGAVCIDAGEAGTHLIADVAGYFPPGASFTSLNPGRLLDTRDGATTIDGQGAGQGAIPAGGHVTLQVAGRHGVPADADAVVLNVTATGTQGWGYVTAYPCDAARPNASNLNYTTAGETTPNAVVTKLAADGTVCLAVGEAGTDLIADVAGYFPPGAGYVPLNPARMLDSRAGSTTVDGVGTGEQLGQGGAPLPAGATVKLPIAGRPGVPADARGAVLNVTMTDTQGWGYVTVFPCDANRPNASNLNSTAAGQTRPNAVFSKLAADGTVCLYLAEEASHLLVDVDGYIPAPTGTEVPPFDPPEPPPTTTPPPTEPGETTTTTTAPPPPPDAEAPETCGAFLSQLLAQVAYDLYAPLLGDIFEIDPNGNGVVCEDYAFLL